MATSISWHAIDNLLKKKDLVSDGGVARLPASPFKAQQFETFPGIWDARWQPQAGADPVFFPPIAAMNGHCFHYSPLGVPSSLCEPEASFQELKMAALLIPL